MRFILLITCFFLISSNPNLYSKEKTNYTNSNNQLLLKSNPYNSLGLHYISVSIGAAGWYNSLQTGMENQQLPLSLNVEYGRTESALGLMLGVNMLSTYVLDDFLLNPNYLSLALSYQPLKKINPFKFLRLYTFGGINMAYTRFTEQIYSGIIDYENKVEKQFGFGFYVGASLSYKIKSFEIGPAFVYNTGKADFLAGYFEKQTFDTGSLQLLLQIKYNIVFNRNKNTCPAYRNFQRFEL